MQAIESDCYSTPDKWRAVHICNLYTSARSREEVARLFGGQLPFDLPEVTGDIYPKKPGYVVRKQDGARIVDVMQWGFPPPAAARAPVTNVRNLASPFWRSALKSPERRCLVPVTRFCEWEGVPGSKIKRWFTVTGAEVFAFAGIWRPIDSGKAYAFLTCEPNPLVAPIHEKAMPVILQPEDYDRWLDGETDDACGLAQPFPSQLMAVV